ncbi:MAG: RNA polymerase sigma factor RpoD/SigA [Verrucomicrobiota bacterium]
MIRDFDSQYVSAPPPVPPGVLPTGWSVPPAPASSVEVPREPELSELPETLDGDFVLRLYIREALVEDPLSAADERSVALRVRRGDPAARERMILCNLRLVVHIAHNYQGMGLPLSDLISEGNLGLMRAVDLYDPNRGARFSTYAGHWIRQRMRRALSNQSRVVRLPESWLQHEPEDSQRFIPIEHRGSSADGEVPVKELNSGETMESGIHAAPEDQCTEGALPGELFPDETTLSPDLELMQQSDATFITDLLDTLGVREQQLLRLRFGLDGDGPRTLEETGRELGLLRQRVHQLESDAFADLRRRASAMHYTPEAN